MGSYEPNKKLDRHLQSALNALTILSQSIPDLMDASEKDELKISIRKLLSGLITMDEITDKPNSIEHAEKVTNKYPQDRSHPTQPDRQQLPESPANLIELNQFLTSLGERISQMRRGAGLTQIKLAQLSGLDRAYLSSIENGRQNVTIGAIYKIAVALGINLQQLCFCHSNDDDH